CFYLIRKESSQAGRDKKHTEFSNGVNLSADSEKDTNELSLDEIEKISSSAGRLLWLAFSGGEIFLRTDLAEITRIFYERNKPAIILFPTNGLLTDVIREKIEKILKYCPKSTIVVKLSLEGPEHLHDSIRGAKGSFRKTMQTYTALGELLEKYPNFDLGINTVFCSENQDHMDEIIEFVNKMDKVKTHTVSLVRGEVSDKKLKDVDIEKYHNTIKKLESNLKNRISSIYRFRGARLKAAQDILQRSLIYETVIQKRQLIPCYAGRLNLVLTETGDLYPCESFTPGMKIGNVRQSDFNLKRLLSTARAKEVIHSIQENGCFCTHECYFMTNILFNPRMYPALLKEYMKI
ncbi:MAG: radical SAM protein, partial [Candidatus Mariimomonas ferrooxydans]